MPVHILFIVAGIALLIWGADRFVTAAGALARNLGVSPMLIGLTIVGFATSAPEMVVSAAASLQGAGGLAVGNAVGSNIANIGLVLGAAALVRPIEVHSDTLLRELPLVMVASAGTLLLCLNGELTRLDGIWLLIALVAAGWLIVRLSMRGEGRDTLEAEYAAEIRADMSNAWATSWLLVGLGVLTAGAEILVRGAVGLADAVGITETVVGLTVVAVGTSLPELAVSIISARKGETGLALGNILGSNIFNILGVVGLTALIRPVILEPEVISFHIPVMLVFTGGLLLMAYNYGKGGGVGFRGGLVLLAGFIAYHGVVVSRSLAG